MLILKPNGVTGGKDNSMKATGIVRRIDDLGRIVVPKEIRRTLRIREGDSLEIYTSSEGSIVLKKYSPIVELSEFASEFAQALSYTLDTSVIVCDKDRVIAAEGENKRQYENRHISKKIEAAIEKRVLQQQNENVLPVYESEDITQISSQMIRPVLSEGITIGAIILNDPNKEAFGEAAQRSVDVAALFIGMQMR